MPMNIISHNREHTYSVCEVGTEVHAKRVISLCGEGQGRVMRKIWIITAQRC